jgi:hypothetical protein
MCLEKPSIEPPTGPLVNCNTQPICLRCMVILYRKVSGVAYFVEVRRSILCWSVFCVQRYRPNAGFKTYFVPTLIFYLASTFHTAYWTNTLIILKCIICIVSIHSNMYTGLKIMFQFSAVQVQVFPPHYCHSTCHESKPPSDTTISGTAV